MYLFKRMKKTNKSNKNIINMTSGSTHNTHWVNRFRPYWPILEFRAGSYNPLTLFLWVRSTTQWWTQPISIHTVYCMCMYPVARAGYLYKLVIVRELCMWCGCVDGARPYIIQAFVFSSFSFPSEEPNLYNLESKVKGKAWICRNNV